MSTDTSSSSRPTLPPLYFHNTNTDSTSSSTVSLLPVLPPEVLHRCLAEYADWGTLARLAAVQQQWSGIVQDAADSSPTAKWELAQALLQGTHGLAPHPTRAHQLLLQLANLPVDDNGQPQKPNTAAMEQDDDEQDDCYYHAAAMKQIAQCYLTGEGVEAPNTTAGLAWMQAAHCWGKDVDAAHDLALIYEHGTYGVQVDVVQAVHWFKTAAEAGHTEAMAEVGLCYELGLAVEQSDEQALEWYMRAAERGNMTAYYSVGEIFEEARGVPQSDEEACLWYYKAAIEGCDDSRRALRRLEAIARIVLPGVGKLLED